MYALWAAARTNHTSKSKSFRCRSTTRKKPCCEVRSSNSRRVCYRGGLRCGLCLDCVRQDIGKASLWRIQMQKNHYRIVKAGTALAVVGLLLSTSATSLGWGAGGHMMVASIAFKRLNPTAKAQAKKLLAIPIAPSNVTRKSTDFVNAAHWPDDVKKLPGFEFSGDLHFIDLPFSTDGTTLPTDLPKRDNIVKALAHYVDVLKTSTDQNKQAQALRFIIHFV